MPQDNKCGFLATEIIFELERVREYSKSKNTTAAKNHLALVEKEILNLSVSCGLGVLSGEQEKIKEMQENISNNNWGNVDRLSNELEKTIVLKQATVYNNGEDPLDVIPSRMWDSLRGDGE